MGDYAMTTGTMPQKVAAIDNLQCTLPTSARSHGIIRVKKGTQWIPNVTFKAAIIVIPTFSEL